MSDTKRVFVAAGGALGLAGFVAALASCCGLPWAVAIFGVTGGIGLARFSYLAPYSLVGALLLVAVAFWIAYRRSPTREAGACHIANRRLLRWAAWIAMIAVASLLVLAYLAPVVT